jgi:hypothetical protein
MKALTGQGATKAHIPYRDSKLTRLLQDSLGGNARTVMIMACSCSSYNVTETIGTMRFGVRAKTVENKAKVNAVRSLEEVSKLLKQAEAKIAEQTAYIGTLEDGDGAGKEQMEEGQSIAHWYEKANKLEKDLKEVVDDREEIQSKLEDVQCDHELLLGKHGEITGELKRVRDGIEAKKHQHQLVESQLAELPQLHEQVKYLTRTLELNEQQMKVAGVARRRASMASPDAAQAMAAAAASAAAGAGGGSPLTLPNGDAGGDFVPNRSRRSSSVGSVTSLHSINENEVTTEVANVALGEQGVLEGELLVDIATMNEVEVREALKLKTLQLQNKTSRLEQLEQSQQQAGTERLKASLEFQSAITRLEDELSGYRTYMDGVLLQGKSVDSFGMGTSMRGGGGGLVGGKAAAKQGAKARRRWSVAAQRPSSAGLQVASNVGGTTQENLLILQTAAASGDESARKMIRRNSKGRMLASADNSDDDEQRAVETRSLVHKYSGGVLGGEQLGGPTSAKGRRRSMVLATNAGQKKGGQLKKGSVRRGSFFSGDTELGLRGGGQKRRQSIIQIGKEAKGEDANDGEAVAAIEEEDDDDGGERTSPEDEDEGERTSPEDEDSENSDSDGDPDFEDVTSSLPSPMRPELLSMMAEKLLQQWTPDGAKRARILSWFRGAIMRQHGKEMKLALRDLKPADYEGFSSILLPLLGVPEDIDLDIDFGDSEEEDSAGAVGGAPNGNARMSLNPMARMQMETQKWKRASVRKRQLPLKVERRAQETVLYDLEVTVKGKNPNLLAEVQMAPSTVHDNDLTPSIMAEYFMKYNPQRLGNIDEILGVFHGKNTLLCQRLHSKYGETPRAPQFKPSRAKVMAKVRTCFLLFPLF